MPKGYKKQINIGDRFGNLEIIKEVEKRSGKRRFLCKNTSNKKEKIVMLCHLISGQSIGFDFSKDNFHITHGMSKTRPYNIWQGIKGRCLRENEQSNYRYYGARGIKVCDRWKNSFENFWEDMKDGYTDQMTIERIDVNSDYTKSNCKWIKSCEQKFNKTSNSLITINGITKTTIEWAQEHNINAKKLYSRYFRYGIRDKERLLSQRSACPKHRYISYLGQEKLVTEWARLYNLAYATVIGRLVRGWTIDKALNTPKKSNGRTSKVFELLGGGE